MMTRPYYGGEAYDSLHRQAYRSGSTAGHYDRAVPYGYHDHRHYDLRAEWNGHQRNLNMIHEQDLEFGVGGPRKRIGVAVSDGQPLSLIVSTDCTQCIRCRKRKIKCSGDPGDGTGCQACRACGADVKQCNFVRVCSSKSCFDENSNTVAGWQQGDPDARRR